ncbi:hypothetical protein E4T39_04858 [Aureobasidium subglaciale]|nr:hypothetical protein E4T39_04858 [Aureobasidium subglaciale]
MKFTAVALAGLATVAMASPAAEANPAPAPAPQPEAKADPAFSSWGKKYHPRLWNGWGDDSGMVYRREADPAFSSWGKKYHPKLWNGWGDDSGMVYRRSEPKPAGTASTTGAAKSTETGPSEEQYEEFERRDPAFSSWRKKYHPRLWNGWGDDSGMVYRRSAEADPAFSSWGKKYHPRLWNGWGDDSAE